MSNTSNIKEYLVLKGSESLMLMGEATVFDDEKFPAQDLKINPATSLPAFDFTEIGFTMEQTGNETLTGICQFSHKRKGGSDIEPHIHWTATAAGTPKFTLTYRWYDIGDTIPAWVTAVSTVNAEIWSSGSIAQYTTFGGLDGSGLTGLSSILEFKLNRIQTDDTYTSALTLKEFDIHFECDSIGSREFNTK